MLGRTRRTPGLAGRLNPGVSPPVAPAMEKAAPGGAACAGSRAGRRGIPGATGASCRGG